MGKGRSDAANKQTKTPCLTCITAIPDQICLKSTRAGFFFRLQNRSDWGAELQWCVLSTDGEVAVWVGFAKTRIAVDDTAAS